MRKAANNDKIGGRQQRRDVKTRKSQQSAVNRRRHEKIFGGGPDARETVTVLRRRQPVNPAALAAQVALATKEAVAGMPTTYTDREREVGGGLPVVETPETANDGDFRPLDEAAEILCGGTKDPVKNLKGRIKRGTVESYELNGKTMVRIDG